jgi:hypothetical protein
MTIAERDGLFSFIANEYAMREVHLPLPKFALIVGTWVALGIGLGLLVAGRLSPPQRAAAGWGLVAIGAPMTIPLVADVLKRRWCARTSGSMNERPPGRVVGAG